MYNKMVLLSGLKRLRPNIKKKITDDIDIFTYTYTLTITILLIQTLFIFITKTKINYKQYKKNPKKLYYLLLVALLITISGFVYNTLIKSESVNKFTPILQGIDLVLLLVFALFFRDIEGITYNHIIGLVLFYFGLYFYNKEGKTFFTLQKKN